MATLKFESDKTFLKNPVNYGIFPNENSQVVDLRKVLPKKVETEMTEVYAQKALYKLKMAQIRDA